MKPVYTKSPAKWLKAHGFKRQKGSVWLRQAFQWVDLCVPVKAGKRGWLLQIAQYP